MKAFGKTAGSPALETAQTHERLQILGLEPGLGLLGAKRAHDQADLSFRLRGGERCLEPFQSRCIPNPDVDGVSSRWLPPYLGRAVPELNKTVLLGSSAQR